MKINEWLNDNQLAIDIWTKKYQRNGENFEEWLNRVSGGNEDIAALIRDKKFLFGGRILASRGITDRKVTYSNCYVLPPVEDSIEGIYDTAKHLARTFSYGGGVGIDISNLRPKGSPVNNAALTTSGAVSFMDTFSQVSSTIGQAGRRGALMISMDCNHLDIEDFIDAKKNTNKLEGCNISVRCTDRFMEEANGNKESEEYGLMMKLAENNWDYAEPGVLFWDTINEYNLLTEYIENGDFKYAGVNPCAEEPLPAGGSCLLGALNLAEFVENPFTSEAEFDLLGFRCAVRAAVIGLNEVLDEGLPLHPLEIQRKTVADWRQIGLGIMGFGDMLLKMRCQYDDPRALDLIDLVGGELVRSGLITSALLARAEGAFPKCDVDKILCSDFIKYHVSSGDLSDSIIETIEKYGLRNSQLFTIAPTGSISTMLGVTGGVEPIFATHYTRRTVSLHGEDVEYKVYTPIVEYMLKNKLLNESRVVNIATAQNIDPFDRVKVQARWQQFIDASISSTVNLPEDITVSQVYRLYMYAWKFGCKGLTIFREGCARKAILNTKEEPKEEAPKLELNSITPITRNDMGARLDGATYMKTTACGKLYVTINKDENGNLVEVFVDPSKSGGCVANTEEIGRLCSAMMRGGMKIDAIVDAMKGVKCSACAKTNKKVDGLSCGDIIARVIAEEYSRNKEKAQPSLLTQMAKNFSNAAKEAHKTVSPKCPECGEKLAFTGGCNTCPNCGYSKCN